MHSAEARRGDADRRLAAWATALLIPMGFLALVGLAVLLIGMPRWARAILVVATLIVGVALGFRAANLIEGRQISWSNLTRSAVVAFIAFLVVWLLAAGWNHWIPQPVRKGAPWFAGGLWTATLLGTRRRQRAARPRAGTSKPGARLSRVDRACRFNGRDVSHTSARIAPD